MGACRQDRVVQGVHLGHVDATPKHPHKEHAEQCEEPSHPAPVRAKVLTFGCGKPESDLPTACGRAARSAAPLPRRRPRRKACHSPNLVPSLPS